MKSSGKRLMFLVTCSLMFEVFNLFNRVQRERHFEEDFASLNFGRWNGGVVLPQFQMQLGARFTF